MVHEIAQSAVIYGPNLKLTLNININNDDYLLRLLSGTRRGQEKAAASLLKFKGG